MDVANQLVVSGSSFSPGVLSGLSMQQIANDLSDPDSQVAQALLGAANQITAAHLRRDRWTAGGRLRHARGRLDLGEPRARLLRPGSWSAQRCSANCLRSTSLSPPQIPCGSLIRIAYSRHAL